MRMEHRLNKGNLIERAVLELNDKSLSTYYEKHTQIGRAGVYQRGVRAFFPELDLTEHIYLLDHPMKDDPETVAITLYKVLGDMWLTEKLKLKYFGIVSYFTQHPTLDVGSLTKHIEYNREGDEFKYWLQELSRFASHFSYPIWSDNTHKVTDVLTLFPVNPMEEKYFKKEDYFSILTLRDFSTSMGPISPVPQSILSSTAEELACRDFVRTLINTFYLPKIKEFDEELRMFLGFIEKMIEEKFDVLSSKRDRGVYKNEWGVTNRTQWDRDLEYFITHFILPWVSVPSFLVGLRISQCNLIGHGMTMLNERSFNHLIFTHNLPHEKGDEYLKELYGNTQNGTEERIMKELKGICEYLFFKKGIEKILSGTTIERTTSPQGLAGSPPNNAAASDMVSIGTEYETEIRLRLEKLGYAVAMTPKTGDQGVDLIANKDGSTYAVQCKNYTGQVGNTAVQEVLAGMLFYDCDYACVVTNSTFTPSASALAQKTGVVLCSDNSLKFFQ